MLTRFTSDIDHLKQTPLERFETEFSRWKVCRARFRESFSSSSLKFVPVEWLEVRVLPVALEDCCDLLHRVRITRL